MGDGRVCRQGGRCVARNVEGVDRSSGGSDGRGQYRDTQTSRANVMLDSGSCHPSSPVFLSAGPFLALDCSAGITPLPGATSIPAGL